MTIVNGKKGKDAFTCVSEKGCSVVDYCLVGCADFDVVKNFMETTLSESMAEMGCKAPVTRVPDHSLLHWQVVVDVVDQVKEDEHERVSVQSVYTMWSFHFQLSVTKSES